MTLTISTVPAYPAVGEAVTLVGTSDTYTDEATQFALTSTPRNSRLALGLVVERHPVVVRLVLEPLTYVAEDERRGEAAAILRKAGSFITDGLLVGMQVDITVTASNNKRVTIAEVAAQKLTLTDADTLIAESVVSTLTAAFFDRGGAAANVITFDAPGEYGVTGYEYFEHLGTGGAYEGDPLAEDQLRLMGTAAATVDVGAYLDLPIEPVSGHGSTLRILVVGDTVRAASLVAPKTDLARVAALDTTVAASVAALIGVAVNSIDVDFVTDVNDLCDLFAAHIILVGFTPVHNSADTTNALLREAANSIPGAIARLNDWSQKLAGHMEATTSGGTWHNEDDLKNPRQVASLAKSLGEAIVLKADLRERVFRRHIAQTFAPESHDNADSTNVPSLPVKALPAAVRDYLDFIAAAAPALPSGESEGIGDAQAAWGFRLS